MPKPNLTGTIYDEPQIFGDNTTGDYNDLYAHQLTELVTLKYDNGSKVPLFELWLDGTSGSTTVQTFDWTRFRDIIRENQPDAVMWGHQGVDARWVGNEDGYTVPTNWHTISRTQDDTRYEGTELQTGIRDGLYWTPAEADARIRDGWFWHASETPRSADALMKMYMDCVGQSVSLLLDVPPDNTGQIAKEDLEILQQFKEQRDAFLDRPLLTPDLRVSASSVRGDENAQFGPANVLDTDVDTYWAMNDNETTGVLEIHLDGIHDIDAIMLQEHIALGQRIGGYLVDAGVDGAYTRIINGTSLGYKRIWNLTTSVEANIIRLQILQANATPLINSVQALGSQKDYGKQQRDLK